MKKFTAVVLAGLLGSSLVYSASLARADDDDRRGNQNEWHDLRHDREQLEQLRRRRDNEAREGDNAEVRRYNRQIRKLENDMRRDRGELRRNERDEHHDRD